MSSLASKALLAYSDRLDRLLVDDGHYAQLDDSLPHQIEHADDLALASGSVTFVDGSAIVWDMSDSWLDLQATAARP